MLVEQGFTAQQLLELKNLLDAGLGTWGQVGISLLAGAVGACLAIAGNIYLQERRFKYERRDKAMLEARDLCFEYLDQITTLQNIISDPDKISVDRVINKCESIYSVIQRIEHLCPKEISSKVCLPLIRANDYMGENSLYKIANDINNKILGEELFIDELFNLAVSSLEVKEIPKKYQGFLRKRIECWIDMKFMPEELKLITSNIQYDLAFVQCMTINSKINNDLNEINFLIEVYFSNYLAKKVIPFKASH